MSHYINSLLIGPVVRQARRFSRPNNESGIEQEPESRERYQNALAMETSAVEEESDDRAEPSQEEGSPSIGTHTEIVSRNHNVEGPGEVSGLASEMQGVRIGGSQAGQNETANVRLIETGSLEPAIPARRYTIQDRDEPSNSLFGDSGG